MKENPEIYNTTHHAEPMEKALSFMKRVYGFHGFRLGQDEILESVLQDSDTLVIMPTGGGKSLCYQVPAFIRPGITLVVSPLIALMKDQVDSLRVLDLPADYQRPVVQSFEGRKLVFSIGREMTSQLNELSRQTGATLYMVLLSAFNILLAKLSGRSGSLPPYVVLPGPLGTTGVSVPHGQEAGCLGTQYDPI